jgi:hypothetical protein
MDGGSPIRPPSLNSLISLNKSSRTEVTEDVEGCMRMQVKTYRVIPLGIQPRLKKKENNGYIASTAFSLYEYHEYLGTWYFRSAC